MISLTKQPFSDIIQHIFPGLSMIAGFFMELMQSALQQTLAAAGFFLLSFLPQPVYSSSLVISNPSTFSYRYTVKENESLTEIAKEKYGSQDYWTTLWIDNPEIVNPDTLEAGMQLRIRTQKPLLVESVDAQLISRAIELPGPRIDPNVAFARAGNTARFVNNSAQITPSPVVNKLAAAVSQPTSNYMDVYKQAGDKYGVPWQVLYGLHVTETGQRDGPISNAQGSGAQGPMQFMPGTWSAYGVDGNGDGIADINNAVDAIHGAANFLAQHGGVQPGLRSYGGNTNGTLSIACSHGYCL